MAAIPTSVVPSGAGKNKRLRSHIESPLAGETNLSDFTKLSAYVVLSICFTT